MKHRYRFLASALLAVLSLQAHAADQRVAARALARLGAEPDLAHAGAYDRFIAKDTIFDPGGSEHLRFDRT